MKSLSVCIIGLVLFGILGCSGSSSDAQNSKLKPIDPSGPKPTKEKIVNDTPKPLK